MPGVKRPVALVGVSEKGVANVEVEAVAAKVVIRRCHQNEP